jgi:hypothetical protein
VLLLIDQSTAKKLGITGPRIRLAQGPSLRLQSDPPLGRPVQDSSVTSAAKKKNAQLRYIVIGSTSARVPASGKGRVRIKLDKRTVRKLRRVTRLRIAARAERRGRAPLNHRWRYHVEALNTSRRARGDTRPPPDQQTPGGS